MLNAKFTVRQHDRATLWIDVVDQQYDKTTSVHTRVELSWSVEINIHILLSSTIWALNTRVTVVLFIVRMSEGEFEYLLQKIEQQIYKKQFVDCWALNTQ